MSTDFRSLVAKLEKAKQARKPDQAEIDRERRQREFNETLSFVRSGTDPAATAAAIVKAAQTRDAGGPELPKPTGAAAAIIAAGKRRRGEIE